MKDLLQTCHLFRTVTGQAKIPNAGAGLPADRHANFSRLAERRFYSSCHGHVDSSNTAFSLSSVQNQALFRKRRRRKPSFSAGILQLYLFIAIISCALRTTHQKCVVQREQLRSWKKKGRRRKNWPACADRRQWHVPTGKTLIPGGAHRPDLCALLGLRLLDMKAGRASWVRLRLNVSLSFTINL